MNVLLLRTPESRDPVIERKIATFDILRNFFGFSATFGFFATLIICPSFFTISLIYTFLLFTGQNYLTDFE